MLLDSKSRYCDLHQTLDLCAGSNVKNSVFAMGLTKHSFVKLDCRVAVVDNLIFIPGCRYDCRFGVGANSGLGIIYRQDCHLATVSSFLDFMISTLGSMLGTFTATCHAVSIVLVLA